MSITEHQSVDTRYAANPTDIREVDLEDLIEQAMGDLSNDSPISINVPEIDAQAQYPQPKAS